MQKKLTAMQELQKELIKEHVFIDTKYFLELEKQQIMYAWWDGYNTEFGGENPHKYYSQTFKTD